MCGFKVRYCNYWYDNTLTHSYMQTHTIYSCLYTYIHTYMYSGTIRTLGNVDTYIRNPHIYYIAHDGIKI